MPRTPEGDPTPVATCVVPLEDSLALTPSPASWESGQGNGYGSSKPRRSTFPVAGDKLLHFSLVSELGAGAFSRVFLASQQDLAGRLVALKVSEAADAEPQHLARLQ